MQTTSNWGQLLDQMTSWSFPHYVKNVNMMTTISMLPKFKNIKYSLIKLLLFYNVYNCLYWYPHAHFMLCKYSVIHRVQHYGVISSSTRVHLLPTAYVVRGKVIFWHVSVHQSVCPHLGGGVPRPGPGGGGVPQPGGVPLLGWSTWYAAVGMPLAFTQEDFLVSFEN